ncbi:MAG: putative porin, partial [Immundisolibacter sp.]|uniref:putative porin n=1 Tax=Immundisolibacter sp. TaxID=1934948 RepID=UPI003EE0738D
MRSLTARICGGLLLAATVPASAAVDGKLLDMLLANGSITTAQHAELSADLARETKAAERVAGKQVKSEQLAALEQKLAWAANTQLKGDVRVRYENIHIEDELDNGGRDKDRQRIRARLGAFSQVNPEVEAGIQIASGGSKDARSTNQDMSDYFNKKDLWLDLAYIDYHPLQVPGLKVFGGKMKQPWVSLGDVIWDGDINPEGAAATYKRKFGDAELFGSAGYFVLQDNIDGDGVQFEHDLRLYAGQAGARFFPGDSFKVTVGGSVYGYDNDEDSAALRVNGNTTDEFRLYEAFGQLDVIGLPLPLSVYGQYVLNGAARGV